MKKLLLIVCSFIVNLNAMQQPGDLHEAIKLNNLEDAFQLMNAGANVNTYDEAGLLPVHYATTEEAKDLLEEFGAIFTLPDRAGHIRLHVNGQFFVIDPATLPEQIPLTSNERLPPIPAQGYRVRPHVRLTKPLRRSTRVRKHTERFAAYLEGRKK